MFWSDYKIRKSEKYKCLQTTRLITLPCVVEAQNQCFKTVKLPNGQVCHQNPMFTNLGTLCPLISWESPIFSHSPLVPALDQATTIGRSLAGTCQLSMYHETEF